MNSSYRIAKVKSYQQIISTFGTVHMRIKTILSTITLSENATLTFTYGTIQETRKSIYQEKKKGNGKVSFIKKPVKFTLGKASFFPVENMRFKELK